MPISLDRLAAIDDHGMPDDEGGRIRTQPYDSRRDLLGLPHPSNRLLRDHSFSPFRGASGEPLHHRGLDDPRAHGIDANVLQGIVEGRRLGQADYAVLGGRVRGLAVCWACSAA
jgi:hypothetical protein